MTTIEQELIELIRNHSTPDLALETAVTVITDFLMRLGSSEGQAPASLMGPA